MTLSPFLVYLWAIADDIKLCFFSIFCISAVALFFISMSYGIEYEDDKNSLRTRAHIYIIKWLSLITIITMAVSVLVPSSKSIAIMVIVPAIVNSEPVQKDIPDLYKIGVEALKESLTTKKQD